MYFNSKNKFYHGIMFHHFHDGKMHTKIQGSLSKDNFAKMIKYIGKENILDAGEFAEKLKKRTLNKEVCLTFDDAIKCQIDIALPILEDFKIKSFFFVPTSMFQGNPDYLEAFRYFRNNYYEEMNDFYNDFYEITDKDLKPFFKSREKNISELKIKYNFYSLEDIKFRQLRDILLSKNEYETLMLKLMKKNKVDIKQINKKLFLQKNDLILLDKLGHVIGLHSHSHPTRIENLSYDEQKKEYLQNKSLLVQILNKEANHIKSSSHPCGSYNHNSLKILKELGVEIAFRDNMNLDRGAIKINNSALEIARQDQSGIYDKMV